MARIGVETRPRPFASALFVTSLRKARVREILNDHLSGVGTVDGSRLHRNLAFRYKEDLRKPRSGCGGYLIAAGTGASASVSLREGSDKLPDSPWIGATRAGESGKLRCSRHRVRNRAEWSSVSRWSAAHRDARFQSQPHQKLCRGSHFLQ